MTPYVKHLTKVPGTPTEAGGIGAVGAVAFAVSRRKMGWRGFCSALIEADQTTAMVFSV